MRILIADDDTVSRTMLQAVLRKWGYEVTTAVDGTEAWEKLQTTDAPRLAVLDWMMPGVDGLRLCRKLRAQRRTDPLYLLLLTSRADRQDIVLGLEAGADDFVAKPYDPEELHARIKVGQRILDLQDERTARQRLQGVLEMAGAVCHELSQPLQIVATCCDLLLRGLDPQDPKVTTFRKLRAGVDRLGDLTGKILRVTEYRTKDYLDGRKIVDLEKASSREELEWPALEEAALDRANFLESSRGRGISLDSECGGG